MTDWGRAVVPSGAVGQGPAGRVLGKRRERVDRFGYIHDK